MPNETIQCGACRHANDPWRRFCGTCGSGLPGGCPGCGTVNGIEDKFCGGCAHALRFTTAPAIGSSRPTRKKAPSTQASTIPIDISELLADGPNRS
jgi:hypothetical protein